MNLARGLQRLIPLIGGLWLLAMGQFVSAATPGASMSPLLRMGPAQSLVQFPQGTAAPQYGLFSCQVAGLRAYSCYDPYQMRRAYQVDSLIAQGFDGTGQTIVIVDAFQNPNLIAHRGRG